MLVTSGAIRGVESVCAALNKQPDRASVCVHCPVVLVCVIKQQGSDKHEMY